MRLKIFLFLLLSGTCYLAYAQPGDIRGIVFDGETGEYLPGVTIFAEGTTSGTITDLDGKFNLKVAGGTYNLRISFISYEILQLTGVEVRAGEVTSLGEIRLEEASISLQEVTITAKAIRNTETALVSIKHKSPNVLDGISEGSIKRIGESDAAGAMKRITGVSVSDGKYVFVRGLGDRYTKSLLNGMDIPGLDPDRNTTQMDIFPTAVINNIIVHKTFSADLPADFTGGAIDIELKDFPETKHASVSLGIAYNPNAHFNKEFLSYEGGKTDFLGFDDGTRAIPAIENIPQFAQAVGNPDGETGQRYQEILGSFNPNMEAMQQMSLADLSLGISYGNQKPGDTRTFGYNFALDYKNSTDFYKNAEYGRYGLSTPDIYEMGRREFQIGDYGVNNVLLSGLASLALKTNKSKYRLNLLLIQNGESKAGIFDFTGSDQGSDFRAFQHGLDYSQRTFANVYLDGNHTNLDKGLKINWKLASTYSILKDPDVRFTRYEINDDGSFRIGTEVGFPERIWRNLDEISTSGAFNLTRNFSFLQNVSKLNFGILATYKYRNYTIYNYAINPRGGFPLTGDPDELFLEENLWPRDGLVEVGTTYETPFIPNNPNKYDANSLNTAGYISTELALLSNFKAILGLRLENFTQRYTGSDQQRENVLNNEKVLEDLGIFPSVNLLYQITDRQNLRASYTQTIARPSFKELSYAEIYDPISGITFIGGFHPDGDDLEGVEYWSGNLVSTDIQNFDLRWERFGGDGQMISISGFYKLFRNPIEIVQYTKQVGAFQPRNVGDGRALGAEFELRQNMAFISESLSALRISTNVTYNSSSIAMSETEYQSRVENARVGEEIEEYREMASMAPYVLNGGLYYTGGQKKIAQRLEGGFYYNVQGSTLTYVGVADRPDIYTKPYHNLNFNASVKLGKEQKLVLGLNLVNILNQNIEFVYKSYQAADQYFERRSPGILTKLKISYTF
ncbi:MAG: TonB-dependent receptor [Bacteroidales bacterium]|nr:TonB-dependent receptor [Bacteroidales bacterium]